MSPSRFPNKLKGFMDLGFVFRKEELSMEIMNIIPRLQQLGKEGRDEMTRQAERRRRKAWRGHIFLKPG
ncbi:hypothetical protein C4D60_Mb01t31820 [Musa balbisiana]|uniref:Uncharacterized protein n=1 Tax=Musa balbisiana TaxID=52838 RepID=A0A4S8JS65_MUSBA|nr:hypothetical protein C4D60_Mb01t31820 [Musa balbisiana]